MRSRGRRLILNLRYGKEVVAMTDHVFQQDAEEDIRTLKNLRNFVAAFAAFSLILALGVAIFAP
jgi:hypothetical protein